MVLEDLKKIDNQGLMELLKTLEEMDKILKEEEKTLIEERDENDSKL